MTLDAVKSSLLVHVPKVEFHVAACGMRVRTPGSGRGRRGGPWALVHYRNGAAYYTQGLVKSRIYDSPDELAKDLQTQFAKAKKVTS